MKLLNLFTYKKRNVTAVTAGDADKVILIEDKQIINVPNQLEIKGTNTTLNTGDYDIYQVQGDSMCATRILDNDYVFAKKIELENILSIPSHSTIILKIDPEREKAKNPSYDPEDSSRAKYKLRTFIMYVDLRNPDDDTIFASLLNMDILSSFQGNRERFLKKISEARDYFKEQLVILSTTYKEEERDYSFHNVGLLIGIVDYYASPPLECAHEVTSVNDNPLLYKEMVEHLSREKVSRFFYGINNDQAIIVLSNIFSSSERIVRLVSNKLSEEITSDENYREALSSFLNKNGTKLEIFVYNYEPNNPIYILLSQYSNKVTLKRSKGAKFTLNDRVVNFCIGDDRMFRIERDIDLRISECNFKDAKTCDNLIKSFNNIYQSDSSETIRLT